MASPRIAVLTGGGDAPGLNAVIRAVVRAGIAQGWEVLGVHDGFEGFFAEDRIRVLGDADVRGILQVGGTILGCSNRGNPFSFPEAPGRPNPVDRSSEVLARIRDLSLRALVVIGGDGSLRIANQLSQRGVPIVGIPKTIDNDVLGTDVTFGFNTACQTVMEAVDRLHTTAASHQRTMVVEVMGRDAGWIALYGGAAGGGDVILIPEIPFEYDVICRQMADRASRGLRFSLVIVAEGAFPRGGKKVTYRPSERVSPEAVRLGGIGILVANELEERTGIESRVTVLGHVQRGGSPTMLDRVLGTRFGVAAIELINRGIVGCMVALRGTEMTHVSLSEVTCGLKLVDPQGSEVRAVEATGVSLGREPSMKLPR